MNAITPTTVQIEDAWYKVMQGDLMLNEDRALRGIIQSLMDYAREQMFDLDGNLIEVQMAPDGSELTEITSDEMARRIAESLALFLYGGTVLAEVATK
jgi:hypothetical protein